MKEKNKQLNITNQEALSRLSAHNLGYAIIHSIADMRKTFTDPYVWVVNWLQQPFNWNDLCWTDPMLNDIYGKEVTEEDLV